MFSLNFYAVVFDRTTRSALSFEIFGQCLNCLGLVGKAANNGYALAFAPLA